MALLVLVLRCRGLCVNHRSFVWDKPGEKKPQKRGRCAEVFFTQRAVCHSLPLKVVQMPHLFLDGRAGLNLDVLSQD